MSRFLKATLFALVVTGTVMLLGSALWQWVPEERAPADEPVLSPAHEPVLPPARDRVTVDVRNAGGVTGMARVATDRLRGAGFDVVGIGNAAQFGLESSVVIDRVGKLETAAAVAEALGIDSVTSDPDPNLFVDVTVRLGSEWMAPQGSAKGTGNRLVEWLRGLGPEKGSER